MHRLESSLNTDDAGNNPTGLGFVNADGFGSFSHHATSDNSFTH